MSDTLLANPFWNALRTEQARFAVGSRRALRYVDEVLPFAGVDEKHPGAAAALVALLAPGEAVFVAAAPALAHPELEVARHLPGLQMLFAGELRAPAAGAPMRRLTPADVPAMLALKQIAFPGLFGRRTHELGAYFGIHDGPELIAMAGERVSLPGLREISALCTHPDHRGHGHAERLMSHLLSEHAAQGLASFLHVVAANHGAIRLYRRMGFREERPMLFRQLRRRH